MKSYLWNRELELGLPFGGKAQLCTQEVSRGKYWTQAMSKKARKVPTATNSIVCSNDVAQQGWFSARSRECSDYKHWTSTWANATVQFHSPPSLPSPPTSGQPRLPFRRKVGLQKWLWAFLATASSGPASFPLGRNINWGSRLPNLLLLQ